MPDTPLVSVIMPAYDAERFVATAIRSVLDQTWRHVEVIVIDDGSSDGTVKVAGELAAGDERVRLIRKEHAGVSAARNAGFAAVRGEYICFLDADDLMIVDRVERQVRFLQTFPSCGLVFSDIYIGDQDLSPVRYVSKEPPLHPIEELLLYRNWLGMLSPMLRTQVQREVGVFDETLTHAEDWDYWIRVARHTRMAYLPGAVVVYRRHDGQASGNWAQSKVGISRVIDKHCHPGSREWRTARAALAWADAQRHWARREPFWTAARLAESLWYARSRRTFRNIAGILASD